MHNGAAWNKIIGYQADHICDLSVHSLTTAILYISLHGRGQPLQIEMESLGTATYARLRCSHEANQVNAAMEICTVKPVKPHVNVGKQLSSVVA